MGSPNYEMSHCLWEFVWSLGIELRNCNFCDFAMKMDFQMRCSYQNSLIWDFAWSGDSWFSTATPSEPTLSAAYVTMKLRKSIGANLCHNYSVEWVSGPVIETHSIPIGLSNNFLANTNQSQQWRLSKLAIYSNKGCHLHGLFSWWKRSPTPKLAVLLPNVLGRWVVNSHLVAPVIDLKRDPFPNEYFCFDGEKLTLSWVSDRHLCLLLWAVLILFTIRAINFIFIT